MNHDRYLPPYGLGAHALHRRWAAYGVHRRHSDGLLAHRVRCVAETDGKGGAMIRLASLAFNAIAAVGAVWLLLAMFAACYKFY